MINSVMLNGLTKGQGKMILLCFGGKITRLPLNVLPSEQQAQPHSQEKKKPLVGRSQCQGLFPGTATLLFLLSQTAVAALGPPALPLPC